MAVCQAIQDCHHAVHDMGAKRITSDVRIGSRVDKEVPLGQGNVGKVLSVEKVLEGWQGQTGG
jgi:uncharacterized protein YqgV (UPF0045/DUF77 family)